MTEAEARGKYPNVSKLADCISKEDKQTRFAALLLLAAMAALNEEAGV